MASQHSKKLTVSSGTQTFREFGHSTLSAARSQTLSLRSVHYIQPVYAISSPRNVLSSDFTYKILYAFLSCQVTQYELIAWNRALLEKLTDHQLVKKCPHFMEPESSLLHSQQHATSCCPEPDQSSPCPTSTS
jgi:hypothetical protein